MLRKIFFFSLQSSGKSLHLFQQIIFVILLENCLQIHFQRGLKVPGNVCAPFATSLYSIYNLFLNKNCITQLNHLSVSRLAFNGLLIIFQKWKSIFMCWSFLIFEDSQNNRLFPLKAWTEELETLLRNCCNLL